MGRNNTMRWLTASTSSEIASDGCAFILRVHCDTISRIEQITVLSRHVDTSGKISDLRDLGQCLPDGCAFILRVHCDTISRIEQITVLSRHVDTSGQISDCVI